MRPPYGRRNGRNSTVNHSLSEVSECGAEGATFLKAATVGIHTACRNGYAVFGERAHKAEIALGNGHGDSHLKVGVWLRNHETDGQKQTAEAL